MLSYTSSSVVYSVAQLIRNPAITGSSFRVMNLRKIVAHTYLNFDTASCISSSDLHCKTLKIL